MSLTLGSNTFDTQLLMPSYKSERHPNGAVLRLSPKKPLEQARAFLAEHVCEILELTRANMALVIEIDDQLTFPWSGVGTTDRGLFFHADNDIKKALSAILITPHIDHEWDITDYRLNRAPTSVAEPHVVEKATRDVLQEQEEMIRHFGKDTPYEQWIEELYANLEKYTTYRTHDGGVQDLLINISDAFPEFPKKVWKRLQERDEVYDHDWDNQTKRTILSIANTENTEEGSRIIRALHGRIPEQRWKGSGQIQRTFISQEQEGTVILKG